MHLKYGFTIRQRKSQQSGTISRLLKTISGQHKLLSAQRNVIIGTLSHLKWFSSINHEVG